MSDVNPAPADGKRLRAIPLSVLDLAPIVAGGSPADSFRRTLDLARQTERLGFHRYWLAEHHNMAGIASSATSVVIGYVAAGTTKIRVGSGGIMLPNHAPLVIAEQFGTLESMYPGRIDLGLGRAPGSDQVTAAALRREEQSDGSEFPQQLTELRAYLEPAGAHHRRVRAIPGEGLSIPIWLLGSSGFSAQLAGELGLPFSFASHFSPDNTLPALALYRDSFRPSAVLEQPYAMVCVSVIAADTDEQARRLSTSQQQSTLNLLRGRPSPLPPPVDSMDDICTEYEQAAIAGRMRTAVVGNPAAVQEGLQAFLDVTQADEIMITSAIYDHAERVHSYELVAQVWQAH